MTDINTNKKKDTSDSTQKTPTKFAIYLNELIDESGESQKKICERADVERTSLNKLLKGTRDKINYKDVQKLADYLNLTVDKRREYFRLYNLSFQGQDTYNNREAVRTLLNHLSSVKFVPTPPPVVDKLEFSTMFPRGEYAIRNAIRNILIYEATHTDNAHFSLFVPSEFDITQELIELWLSGKDFTADSLLCFHSSQTDSVKNIQLLQSVIPLCLASRGKYCPYYFTEAYKSVSLSPMSYYIITPHYLVQLSEDLAMAHISENIEFINYYSESFGKLLEYCAPLTQCSSNIIEVLQEYISGTAPDSLNVMMTQPCPGRYITPEVIRKYMNNGTVPYKEMFNLVEQHFSVLRQIKGNYETVFTQKGLKDFIDTCTMADLPPQYVPPLEKKDIKQMLMYLYKEIEMGTVKGIIVKPSALQLPDCISICVSQNGLHIYTTNEFIYGAYCCNIHITEKSLCNIFSDFMKPKSLEDNNLVYSKEDTLNILKQHISEMDA